MAYNLEVVPRDATRESIEYRNRSYELVCSQEGVFHHVLYRDGRALSFSPPKAYPPEIFEANCPFSECVVEEWIEGDALNLFFDGGWDICTPSGVGGNDVSAGNDNTLRNRFFEACSRNGLALSSLNVQKCYSFVLNSDLWLVACYEITDNVARSTDSHGEFRNATVRRPEHLVATTYEEARERFVSYNCDVSDPSIMVYHIPSNKRTKICNPARELSHIDLKIQHRFFHMRSEDRKSEYLEHFPADAEVFDRLESHVVGFTTQLHKNYIDCYVNKSFAPPLAHRVHLHYLHQGYLRGRVLSPVTMEKVRTYVDELNPIKLLYTINPAITRK